jgi:Nucleotidyl transferase AbiEii toxin, Type IV TA system
MHTEILSPEQVKLLPLIKKFSKDFGLVGGTAIALHIGHRESIDFDLFSYEEFRSVNIKRRIERMMPLHNVLVNRSSEFTFMLRGVRITFFQFPFKLKYEERLDDVISIPSMLTLAAMKAFALGQRSKWKDYVDLYFIFRDYYSLDEVIRKADKLFSNNFNGKIFRTQLSYFDDINYDEAVSFLPGFEVNDDVIKQKLTEFSLME